VRALGQVVADADTDDAAGGPQDPDADPDAGAPEAAVRPAELEPGRPA
jgi:hypothetical protein